MSITTSQLPPKTTIETFTADSASSGAADKARGDNMQRELIAMTAALYHLKAIAERLTPKTIYDWNAMTAKDQERAVELVRGLTRGIEALLAGSEE